MLRAVMRIKKLVVLFLCFFVLLTSLWKISRPEFRITSTSVISNSLGQSVAAPPKDNVGPVLIVFWSTVFGARIKLHESWKKGQCPVACSITSDITRAREATAFMVHARDPHPLPPRDDVPWILFTQENPVYTPVLQDPSYMSKFKLLRSYRLDSDIPNPVFPMPNLIPPVPFKNKTGNIMAAFTNCEPVRTEYLTQLMEFVRVDSYGACLHNKDGLNQRYGQDFQQRKTLMARNYKFLLVFFNQDCDYFVDNQLSHALNAGAVPVVMGTDKIKEFTPGNLRNAYIKVRDFKSPGHLAEYLKFLGNNETEYNKYLEWKSKGLGDFNDTTIGKYLYPQYPLRCQLCVKVAEGNVHNEGLKPDICQARRYSDWGIEKGARAKEDITK